MSITFNADEIFEMAEEIERNGAKFYSQAAEKATDADIKEFFKAMAGMEEGHLAVFSEMRKELAEAEKAENVYDPENEAVLYLQAMADARGFEGKASKTVKFTGGESMSEVIEAALNAEKESVVFYYGLKSLVSDGAGKDKVENIILEELGHIRTLLSYLQKLN